MKYTIATFPANTSLTEEKLLQAAHLIYASDSQFLDNFFAPNEAVIQAIKINLTNPGSDLAGCTVAIDGDTIIGICCGYPAIEMFSRQLTSLRTLLPIFKKDIDRDELHQFGKSLPQAPKNSMYLAKIAVSKKGYGIGRTLLDNFEKTALDRGIERVSLHVRSDNSASEFYEACGYEIVKSAAKYLLLVKHIES